MPIPDFYENIHIDEFLREFTSGRPITKEEVEEVRRRFYQWFTASIVLCWHNKVSKADFLKAMEKRGAVYTPMPTSVEDVNGEKVPCAGFVRWKKDGAVNSYVEERFCKLIAETLDKRSMEERTRIMREYFKKNRICVSGALAGTPSVSEDDRTYLQEDTSYDFYEGQDQE